MNYLQSNDMIYEKFIKSYWALGMIKPKNEDSTKIPIFINQKQWYFVDTKSYNAFIRIRREHLKKLGIK